ncbi:MAG: uracil-DNA glycosylase [Planctomycetes bacterium]|nr:uracil-DNA glycosylase [Planctomycetota bacterium]
MEDSLERIAQEIRTASSCPLARSARHAVPGEGPSDARIFLVGQAPGAKEDMTGRPFVGAAGRLLTHALQTVGLSREEVFITSVEKFYPPGDRPPTKEEIAACKPFLLRQIRMIDPPIVVLLGRVAERTMAEEPALIGRCVLITIHPAAVFRTPELKRRLAGDMQTLRQWLTEEAARR